MGMLDDARKAEAEAQAAARAAVDALGEKIRQKRIDRDGPEITDEQWEERFRLSEEQGRQLSEEFLNEVRMRHLEPNDSIYGFTTKREWVRHTDYSGHKLWGWSAEEVISRGEPVRCFTISHDYIHRTTLRTVKHHIDPATGQGFFAEKKLVKTLPAIKRWIGRGRPETEIYMTSFVRRPLMNIPGLDRAMLDFLEQTGNE
jgi:hypothetical protein